ncbi:hypothetical protein GGQ68_001938 [Sagittula marina]|uniref:Uncharacterized protein n=1 Tax=Sagittula marina TaxID=943940 RepID=A0A7W6DS14_9RHOB|nr:hypothetical protein [Sagittula marina]
MASDVSRPDGHDFDFRNAWHRRSHLGIMIKNATTFANRWTGVAAAVISVR